jgi:aminotransferase
MRFARTRRLQLSPIKEIELAAARLPDAVSLAQGIPSFDTPAVIKDYVKEKLDQGVVAKYSLAPGLVELRELVAEHLRRDGMHYDPDGEILITAGSIEGISATLLAITEPGDEVILPSPSYASYQQAIRLAGCEPRFVPLNEERNFDLDVEAIAKRITPRTAAIFYCNPNNPTGTLYTRAQSLRMMELAERHDLMIITDEVYKDFLFGDEPYFTPAQVDAFRRRVVRIFSLSKAYAMTGWRVGYLHSDRAVVAEILKVHDALVTCAPVISQYGAIAALERGEGAVAEFRGAYKRRRDLMLRHLDELSHVFDYQKPTGAYFVFPRIKDTVPLSGDSRRLAFDLLARARVALVPGSAFGPTGESHLRMSYGRDEADIEEAFRRMREYFSRGMGQTAWAGVPSVGQEGAELGATGSPRPTGAAPSRAPGNPLRRALRALAVGYLHALARLYLRRRRPLVIAIAGNRGKTVLKRTLAELLRPHRRTRANPRSYNTEIGLPLAVLGLEIDPRRWRSILRTMARASARAVLGRPPADLLVLELGARRPGDMARLLATVRPDWAIVTPLAGEAVHEPGELAVLREEMAVLCRGLAPERLLLCTEDPLLEDLARQHAGAVRLAPAGLEAVPGGYRVLTARRRYDLGADVVGASAALAVQAAILLGERLGLAPDDIQEFVGRETGLAGRAVAPPAAPPPGRVAAAG